MKKIVAAKKIVSLLLCMILLLGISACTSGDGESSAPTGSTSQTSQSDASQEESKAPETTGTGAMTDVGTPRSETLIVDILSGRTANPDLFNPYVPGAVPADAGAHQLLRGKLWEIDTVKGEQYGDLAATLPEAVEGKENTYTFKMKENLLWSDGEALDAHDVAFTFNMLLESEELAFGAVVRESIKSCQALDDLTVELVTHKPEAKLSQKFS